MISRTFLIYAVLRLLKENNRVMVMFKDPPYPKKLLVFEPGQAPVAVDEIDESIASDRLAWFFCDSIDPHRTLPCRMVMCTSPREEVGKQFKKLARQIIMPIWTFAELLECRSLNYHDVSPSVVLARYYIIGGIPRYVLQYRDISGAEFLNEAFSGIETEHLTRLIESNDSSTHLSHRIIHMHSDNNYRTIVREYASELAGLCTMMKFEKVSNSAVLRIFEKGQSPEISALRGHIFERFVHHILATGGSFRCRNLSSARSKEAVFRLPSNMRTEIFKTIDQCNSENVYYRPIARNFESIDSLVLQPGCYKGSLFQITLSQTHRVTSSIFNYARKVHAGGLYFVVHDEVKFKNYVTQSMSPSVHENFDPDSFQEIKGFCQYCLLVDIRNRTPWTFQNVAIQLLDEFKNLFTPEEFVSADIQQEWDYLEKLLKNLGLTVG